MTTEMLLNIGLSTVLAIFGWILKSHVDDSTLPSRDSRDRRLWTADGALDVAP